MTNDAASRAAGRRAGVRRRLGGVVRALRIARPRPARRRLDRRAPSSWPASRSARSSSRRSPPARCAAAGARCARTPGSSCSSARVPVAGAQFAYFSAVQRMDVGPALLIEYTAPAAVVVWLWLRHGERPGPLTVAGAGLAALGLVLVLDLLSGADLAPRRRALGADRDGLRRLVLRARRQAAPGPAAGRAGRRRPGEPARSCSPRSASSGILPMHATTASPVYADSAVAWWLPLLGLGRRHGRARLLHRDRRQPAPRLAPLLVRRPARGRRRRHVRVAAARPAPERRCNSPAAR